MRNSYELILMNKENNQLNNLLSLDKKVAIITGGASGIGLSTAKLLADMGATVALVDVNEKRGKIATEEINKVGGKAKFYSCDVTKDSDCKKAVEAIVKEFGKIDILFNNAGIIVRKNIIDLHENEWDLVINVSLKAIFLLSRYVRIAFASEFTCLSTIACAACIATSSSGR